MKLHINEKLSDAALGSSVAFCHNFLLEASASLSTFWLLEVMRMLPDQTSLSAYRTKPKIPVCVDTCRGLLLGGIVFLVLSGL